MIEIGMKIGMKIRMEIRMELGMKIGTGSAAVDGMVLVENSLLTAVKREDVVDLTHKMVTLALMIIAASVQQ